MGIIKRQGIKKTVVNYLGVLISGLSMFFIYSDNKEMYGLAQFLISSGMVLMPLVLLGAPGIPVRYYPVFKNKNNGHNGFLTLIFMLVLGGIVLTLILSLASWYFFDSFLVNSGDDPLLEKYVWFVIPMAILLSLASLITSHTSNFQRVVIPSIYNSLLPRLGLALIILLVSYSWITTGQYVWSLLMIYAFSVIGLTSYLWRLKELKFTSFKKFLDKKLLRQILIFAMFGLLGSIGTQLTMRLDSIMVGKMIDMKNNGAYNILAFIVGTMHIPAGAIFAIAGPLISNSLKSNELDEVYKIYKKSSLILVILGFMFLGLILLSIEDFISLMPKSEEYTSILGITLFLGLARMFDMATTVNTHIILYSKYFKFNLYVVLILGILNIVFNYYFILEYGLLGAALASFLALTIFNILKLAYIKYRFNMQPFTLKTIWVLLIGCFAFTCTWFLSINFNSILGILVRSIIYSILFVFPIIFLNISEDATYVSQQLLKKVKSFFGHDN